MKAADTIRLIADKLEQGDDWRDLTDRQDAVISAGALLLLDTILRSPQDMRERARVLLALMGD